MQIDPTAAPNPDYTALRTMKYVKSMVFHDREFTVSNNATIDGLKELPKLEDNDH